VLKPYAVVWRMWPHVTFSFVENAILFCLFCYSGSVTLTRRQAAGNKSVLLNSDDGIFTASYKLISALADVTAGCRRNGRITNDATRPTVTAPLSLRYLTHNPAGKQSGKSARQRTWPYNEANLLYHEQICWHNGVLCRSFATPTVQSPLWTKRCAAIDLDRK